MRVEVVKPFATYGVGAVIPDMPGGQARTLIARGLVCEAAPEAQYEDRQASAPVDRMLRAGRRGGLHKSAGA